jgi:hypothetical protein
MSALLLHPPMLASGQIKACDLPRLSLALIGPSPCALLRCALARGVGSIPLDILLRAKIPIAALLVEARKFLQRAPNSSNIS